MNVLDFTLFLAIIYPLGSILVLVFPCLYLYGVFCQGPGHVDDGRKDKQFKHSQINLVISCCHDDQSLISSKWQLYNNS